MSSSQNPILPGPKPQQPTPQPPPDSSQTSSSADQSASTDQRSYMDPAGTWAKFLSTANSSATKEDVEIFLGHLMKFMGTLIHASDVSHKRAMEQLKRAAEGKD